MRVQMFHFETLRLFWRVYVIAKRKFSHAFAQCDCFWSAHMAEREPGAGTGAHDDVADVHTI